MYGQIALQDKIVRVKLVQRTLEFYVKSNDAVYRRVMDGNLEYECEVVSVGAIFIEPVAPVFTPKRLTHFILVEFTNNVVLSPESSTSGYTRIPVDIAVFAVKGEEYRVIDVFSENKVKYALYGPKNEGVIARYYKSRFSHEVEGLEYFKEAIVPLEVINSHDKWVKFTQVLLDANMLNFYYEHSGKACTQKVKVEVTSDSSAVVEYSKEDVKGMYKARKPLKLTLFMPSFRRTEMMWGI